MKIYFTLTGTKYYQGSSFMEPGTRVYLRKEPDNEYDKEAILLKDIELIRKACHYTDMNTREELIRMKEESGMSWRHFAEYFAIPYRTMQDWQKACYEELR